MFCEDQIITITGHNCSIYNYVGSTFLSSGHRLVERGRGGRWELGKHVCATFARARESRRSSLHRNISGLEVAESGGNVLREIFATVTPNL